MNLLQLGHRVRDCDPRPWAKRYDADVFGPLAIGVWVAHAAFWVLLILGIATGELSARRAGIFVALWLAGYLGLPFFFLLGPQLITSYVAMLDIVLVFIVVKGDVRLS